MSNSLYMNGNESKDCGTPLQHDPFNTCEFDHMYTSFTETKPQKMRTEVEQLKELLLLHLDLIQRQSEQIVEKDKKIQELALENETLRQRLERMDRRVSLQQKKVDQSTAISPSLINQTPSSTSPNKEETLEVIKKPDLVTKKLDFSLIKSEVAEKENIDVGKTITPIKREKLDKVENEKELTCSIGKKRKRNVSKTEALPVVQLKDLRHREVPNKEEVTDEPKAKIMKSSRPSIATEKTPQSLSKYPPTDRTLRQVDKVEKAKPIEATSKRLSIDSKTVEKPSTSSRGLKWNELPPSEWLLTEEEWKAHVIRTASAKGNEKELQIIKKENILLSEVSYDVPTAEVEQDADLKQENVEVPSWRMKLISSAYSMEGTENIEDENITRRHLKYETDEKRRKRWDIQRIREQRQYEKLKQRYNTSDSGNNKEEIPNSFYPDSSKAKFLQVMDWLPVCAFGYAVPDLPGDFCLPWHNSEDNSVAEKKRPVSHTPVRKQTRR